MWVESKYGFVIREFANQLANLKDLVWVEPGRGLIENHHLRVVNERLRQPHALPVPFRQLAHQLAKHRLESAAAHHPIEALVELSVRETAGTTDKIEVIAHFHLRVQWQNLRQVANELAHRERTV